MPEQPLTVAYLTSGAAGMYCGSCLHDNTLARALTTQGIDVQLIPTYTPIRTDEKDVSLDRLFFGGLNVYLQQRIPLFRRAPSFVTWLLDRPGLIRFATSLGFQPNYQVLGGLTVSMLQGRQGFQKEEVEKLTDWLAGSVRPNLIVFSNVLIGGCIPALKERLSVPTLVTLQGDDIFLDALPEPYRTRAVDEIRRLVEHIDGFIVNSHFYAEYMGRWFQIPPEKIHVVPLGIDTRDFEGKDRNDVCGLTRPRRVGYLARLAPEKGLHVLADAFLELRKRSEMNDVELHVAGWLGDHNKKYANQQFQKIRNAGLGDSLHHAGSVDRHAKVEFLRKLDVFSVPTTYHEPKGLFVLESLAAGVPVVLPNHGAFPEMLERLGGGVLVPPEDPRSLADQWHKLLTNDELRRQLGQQGRKNVFERHNAEAMAKNTIALFQRHLK